jgi:MoxR-like ATPase
MKPSHLYRAIVSLIAEQVPLHIWGPPGVGKSQIVAEVARDLQYEFLDVRASQLDPVDWRGNRLGDAALSAENRSGHPVSR